MADHEMQAWTGNAVTLGTPREPAPEAGGWLTVQQGQAPVMQRDRVGRQAANTLFGTSTSVHAEQMARQDRLLNDEQLWLVYKRTPDVRAAIDAIVRRVATWDWVVEPTLPPTDPGYQQALDDAKAAATFLKAPNTDGETWQEVWTKAILDLMVFDAGVIENVFAGELNADGTMTDLEELEELVALRGSTVFPVVDTHGHIMGYRQNTTGVLGPFPVTEGFGDDSTTINPMFSKEQIVYMRLFPNTASPLGVPLIETVVNEIITMLRQAEHSMLAFDADEIPPGILVLTGIAGKAAAAAKADLQKLRGKDHKVRVITNPDPKATGAHWVELRRTAKDVDMVNVVNQVRRTIWRVFGVLPVEMGASEDVPRAVGQVQLEVSGSHLINPILELVEAKVNARILPLVVGDSKAGQRLKFRFDRESKLSADDQKAMAATLTSLIREGVMTRNEARKVRGDQPVEGGDVMTITTGQGTFPLVDVVTGTVAEPVAAPQAASAPGEASMLRSTEGVNMSPPQGVRNECQKGIDWYEEGHGGDGLVPATVRWARRLARGEDITEDKVRKMRAWLARHEVDKKGEGFKPGEDGYPSPGRVAWALWGGDPAVPWSNKLVQQIDNNNGSRLDGRSALLPSEWQPAGPFAQYRTLDLTGLGDEVMRYRRVVQPLYAKANTEVVAAVRSMYRPGGLGEDAAARLTQRISRTLDRLEQEWAMAVEQVYVRTARLGARAARDFTGLPVVEDVDERGRQYGERAMRFLTGPDGLVTDLRARLLATVQAMTTRAAQRAPRGTTNTMDTGDAAEAAGTAFEANEHRIDNWGGRLVELASLTLVAGMLEGGSTVEEDGQATGGPQPVEWWADWVHVGDRAMCGTCEDQGTRGFRPLSSFQTVPGGDTECRARCRCVLVLWTRSEVEKGTAVRLSGRLG